MQVNDVPDYCFDECCSKGTAEPTGIHTAIFLEDLGDDDYRVVDSNWNLDDVVHARTWEDPEGYADYYGLYLHVYRIASTTQSDYIFNEERNLPAVDDNSVQTCESVSGGSETNWMYTCVNETSTFDQYDTVQVLAGIHNIREDHRFETDFYCNSEFQEYDLMGWNYVEPYVWEHAFTWPTFYASKTGSCYAHVFYLYNGGYDYLDTVYFTVE